MRLSSPLLQALGLHDVEMAALFHVTTAEVAEWRRTGVPEAGEASVRTVEDVAKRLAVWIEPERLADFVRRPRVEFSGRPLLQALAEDGPESVHAEIDRMLAAGVLP